MRKSIFLTLLAFVLAPPLLPMTHAALIYREGEGWTTEDASSGPAEKSASEQLHKAEALEAKGKTSQAIDAYVALLRKFPHSGIGSTVHLRLAALYDKNHDPERAFKTYAKYLSVYPHGADFDVAVEGEFRIAKEFLAGERRKVFGVKTFSSMERAQQMFQQIVNTAPFSKFAPLSQFNVGQALEKQAKEDEAIAAYQQVVDKYPLDEVASDAQYQIGYIYLNASKHGSNDHAARVKARESFEDFTIKYPKSEKAVQAQENIKFLSGTDTKKTLEVAEYYEHSGDYKAAVIYYNDVINAAPESPEAATARKRLSGFKGAAGAAASAATAKTNGKSKGPESLKVQAKVETASRPDYAGPPAPSAPVEMAPAKPQLRTPDDLPPASSSQPSSSSLLGPQDPAPALGMPAPEPSLPSQ